MIGRPTPVFLLVTAALLLVRVLPALAQGLPDFSSQAGELMNEWESLKAAAIRLPVAAALGAALALRPRQAGTPPRRFAVVQTQVLLSIIGALVMLVVGVSLARAFGVVGIAGLVRYRAKVEDPKDAGVMLAALAVGLASGVGLVWLGAAATLFLLVILWLIESKEPEAYGSFTLKVAGPNLAGFRRRIESLLRRHRVEYDLRNWSADEIAYALMVPLDLKTQTLSGAIVELTGSDKVSIEWDETKKKN
jgi:hypothetical protein